MRRNLLPAVLACVAAFGHAQSDAKRPELFTSYFSATTPIFKVHIPAEACHAIISQGDGIVSVPERLKALNRHDLQVASLNLRACATSEDLARIDRDLAVGLYAEAVSELERRERGEK